MEPRLLTGVGRGRASLRCSQDLLQDGIEPFWAHLFSLTAQCLSLLPTEMTVMAPVSAPGSLFHGTQRPQCLPMLSWDLWCPGVPALQGVWGRGSQQLFPPLAPYPISGERGPAEPGAVVNARGLERLPLPELHSGAGDPTMSHLCIWAQRRSLPKTF